MSDDEFGDLLAGLDDETPRKSRSNTNTSPAKSAISKTPLSNLFGAQTETAHIQAPAPKRSVNFGDQAKEETTSGMRSSAGRTTNLNDLFGPPSSSSGAPAPAPAAPRRAGGGGGGFDFLFDTSAKSGGAPSAPAQSAPAADATAPPPTAAAPESRDNLDAGRIARLETELERVNRELEDTKRKKREDEEDLETFWKSRLDAQTKDANRSMEELKNGHKAQVSLLQDEHKAEIERLKLNYERQLENVTSSASQVGDLVAVVGKVDSISSSIDRIAADVVATTNKVSTEQSALLQIQEEKLRIREEKFYEEQASLKAEKLKTAELNLKLTEMLKKQEQLMEEEKWKVKEEWNKLKAEKQIFKEDQKHVLESTQKEKQYVARATRTFHESQHELLVRVSTERQLLEQEKNEFFAKRDQDIKRIKSEAFELDLKIQQITTAEQHVIEMKLVNETKFRQLQNLEGLLIAECSEIERMRNELKNGMNVMGGSSRRPRHLEEDDVYGVNNSNQNTQRRSESVKASLKKHYDLLDRYAGQKVAPVAPQNRTNGSEH